MEFTAPQAGDMTVFKALREDFKTGLGCVDLASGKIDPPKITDDRMRTALKFLAPERITLNLDCGSAPGSWRCGGLGRSHPQALQRSRSRA